MSSEEIKVKRSQSRKKNIYAKALYDPGDHKGAFKIKIKDPRKGEYKRIKLSPNMTDDSYDWE